MKRLAALVTCAALLACADSSGRTSLDDALDVIPAALSPGRLSLRVAAGHSRIQASPDTREIVVSADLFDAHRSVWLHEIAHVRFHPGRPSSTVGRRLVSAIEEGVADYFAATLQRSPRVGDPRIGVRDLARPPARSLDSWAALGLPGFDSHVFGWSLAAELWRREPRAGALLTDLVRVLESGVLARHEIPRDVLGALVDACPSRSRSTLRAVLSAWAPSELHDFNDEESP